MADDQLSTEALSRFEKAIKDTQKSLDAFDDATKSMTKNLALLGTSVDALIGRVKTAANDLRSLPGATPSAPIGPLLQSTQLLTNAQRDSAKVVADFGALIKQSMVPLGGAKQQDFIAETNKFFKGKTTSDLPGMSRKSVFDVSASAKPLSDTAVGIAGGLGTFFQHPEVAAAIKKGSDAGALLNKNILTPLKNNPTAFLGKQGGGAAVAAWSGAANASISGFNTLMDATNVKGKGQRALRGAAAGAALGTEILPGWGTAIGAGVGALVGVLRHPAFEDISNRVKKNFGGIELTDATSQKIADTAKDKFKGNRQAAEIFSLGDIIKEGGGISDKNVDALTARLHDAFSMVQTGKFTSDQLKDTLNKNFDSFAQFVTKSKDLASKSFQEIIALNQQFGTNSESVQKFVAQQSTTLGKSVSALAGPLASELGKFSTAVSDAQAKVNKLTADGKTGTSDYAKAVADLGSAQSQMQAKTADASVEFQRLGLLAFASFNASKAAGTDTLTALTQLSPALVQLTTLQTQYHLESNNSALDQLLHFKQLVDGNQALVLSASALGETMRALTSIGGLNADTFAALEAQGVETFDRLKAAGFDDNEALSEMKDFLANVRQAHEDLGLPIDENTQKLIDMAQAQGILKDEGMSMTDILKGGFDNLTAAVNAVAKALGADVPTAAQQATDAINKIPRDVDINAHVNLDDSGLGVPENARGGIATRPTFGIFGEAGPEALLPLSQLDQFGGASEQSINIWLDGRMIARTVVKNMPSTLDVYGATR
jgi:hypothetical protein